MGRTRGPAWPQAWRQMGLEKYKGGSSGNVEGAKGGAAHGLLHILNVRSVLVRRHVLQIEEVRLQ
jgi:hypothetical protein